MWDGLTTSGPPPSSINKAATAATWGAAADVPKNGAKNGKLVFTPSAPATSGLKRVWPGGQVNVTRSLGTKRLYRIKTRITCVNRTNCNRLANAQVTKHTATGNVVFVNRKTATIK